jgi:hypothetical protein
VKAISNDPVPVWWTDSGGTDILALVALATLLAVLLLVLFLYAWFDRYAGNQAQGTPLRTTIPTLLTLALAYDLFPPLATFSILLPLTLILAALARDYMLWRQTSREN